MSDPNRVFSSVDENNPICSCSAQWIMLYTFAAYLPDYPNENEQKHANIFYSYFPDQCVEKPFNRCYREYSDKNPPPIHDRKKLMYWIQLAENECRARAGLPKRIYSYKKLMSRWRYPDGYI